MTFSRSPRICLKSASDRDRSSRHASMRARTAGSMSSAVGACSCQPPIRLLRQIHIERIARSTLAQVPGQVR